VLNIKLTNLLFLKSLLKPEYPIKISGKHAYADADNYPEKFVGSAHLNLMLLLLRNKK